MMNDTSISWNGKIGSLETSSHPQLLPERDYPFEVVGLERGRYQGGNKIGPCDIAKLTLRVNDANRIVDIKTNLLLDRSLEWRLCSFFCSIGLMHEGEEFDLDWSHVVGAKGMAHIIPDTYEKNGKTYHVNTVKRYLEKQPDDSSSEAEDSDF